MFFVVRSSVYTINWSLGCLCLWNVFGRRALWVIPYSGRLLSHWVERFKVHYGFYSLLSPFSSGFQGADSPSRCHHLPDQLLILCQLHPHWDPGDDHS